MVRKHSKNITAGSVFTAFERNSVNSKWARGGKYGSESQRQFEHCWLCLKTARNPVMTVHGYLFCKECIVLNLGSQKKEQQLQEIVSYCDSEREILAIKDAELLKEEDEIRKFSNLETAAVFQREGSRNPLPDRQKVQDSLYSNKEEKRKGCFWLAENAPTKEKVLANKEKTNESKKVEKKKLCCPISGKPLKLKNLIPLCPDVIQDTVENGNLQKVDKWACHISNKKLTCQPAVVIEELGYIVTRDVAEKYLLGKVGTLSGGRKLTISGLRLILPGGSGFSALNTIESYISTPLMD